MAGSPRSVSPVTAEFEEPEVLALNRDDDMEEAAEPPYDQAFASTEAPEQPARMEPYRPPGAEGLESVGEAAGQTEQAERVRAGTQALAAPWGQFVTQAFQESGHRLQEESGTGETELETDYGSWPVEEQLQRMSLREMPGRVVNQPAGSSAADPNAGGALEGLMQQLILGQIQVMERLSKLESDRASAANSPGQALLRASERSPAEAVDRPRELPAETAQDVVMAGAEAPMGREEGFPNSNLQGLTAGPPTQGQVEIYG